MRAARASCRKAIVDRKATLMGAVDRMQYPAECFCIAHDKRTVWEKLRDSMW